jgi:hypothetical protein
MATNPPTTTRKLNVQTPGGAAADSTVNPTIEDLEALGGNQGGPQSGTELDGVPKDVAELQAQLQALKAENAKLKQAKTVKTDDSDVRGASATSHKHLRADQIDAKKLVSPVLSADGWVVPDDSDKKARA